MTAVDLPTPAELNEALDAQHRRFLPLRNWLQPGLETIPTRRRIVAVERIDGRAQCADVVGRCVVAGDADQHRLGAEGHEIGRDIAGATQQEALGPVVEHRHGRLRRDPPDLAFDEAVEQNVAADDDPCLSEPVYDASIHGAKDLFSL